MNREKHKASYFLNIPDKYFSSLRFSKDGKLFLAQNVHVPSVKFESTTLSGLMRKLNNYLK